MEFFGKKEGRSGAYILQGNLSVRFPWRMEGLNLGRASRVWEGKIEEEIFPSQSRPDLPFFLPNRGWSGRA
jgi:hypothetical protein